MPDKIYNLRQLEELAGGSDDFVNSMIETFLEYTPNQLDEMLTAHAQGNLEALGALAHKIKPNIDLFEIQDIRDDIRLVEEQAKNRINSPQIKESLDRVEATLRKVFKQLEQR